MSKDNGKIITLTCDGHLIGTESYRIHKFLAKNDCANGPNAHLFKTEIMTIDEFCKQYITTGGVK